MYRRRSLLGDARPGSRETRLKKRFLISAVVTGFAAACFFLVGFIRFGSWSLWLTIGLLGSLELLRGIRYLLRVFSFWMPGLSIWYARYESWMDEKIQP
ncbi:hypothetical protein PhaeoP57_02786 [Phaeobacter inhibens]|nr:hypothetical protein PhaeoP51_02824 [Phaeobacter inhibens]AUQ83681.1 hypothetical protein PhaeoP57_02786 [Phaeobacter inhibens]AUQ91488.1 hypothetical protein PhaeoP24_02904 [Phaeobacter inhibens]AUR08991.1 hypothetical protein PhaeoP59_02843 [Phaeobacter inhibens]AUR12824.1 hypothetical protein PhaeoP48_02861 [Phaeobacter inhibens]